MPRLEVPIFISRRIPEGRVSNSDWYRTEDYGKITVPVTTLDTEIAKFGTPEFCKIDVEGFEVEVLKGLSSPIKALSIEFQCDERGVAKISQCVDMLSKFATYEFNLVGTEEGKWLSPHWMSSAEFLSSFPACKFAFLRRCFYAGGRLGQIITIQPKRIISIGFNKP